MTKETTASEMDTVENDDGMEDDPIHPVETTVAEKPQAGKSMMEDARFLGSLPGEAPVGANDGSLVPLISLEESQRFRTAWTELQGKFVDEPRSAVKQADELVSEVIKQLVQMFAHEHASLDSKWNRGDDVSTEDLRQSLLRYHSFFNRLVV